MTRWLDIAWAELGVQETSGNAATPAILRYFRDAGRGDITSDEVAWCAAFAGACLERGGIPQTIAPARALLARSYLDVGAPIDKPRVGALAILSRGSDPVHGHVGFVVGETDNDLVLLGGNQSNRVSVAHYPKSRLVGLRWPDAAPSVDGSRIAKAARQQQADAAKAGGSGTLTQVPPADVPAFPSPTEIAGQASGLQSALETVISFAGFAAGKLPWLALALALYWGARMAWNAWRIRGWRIEDAATGKTVTR